jgi:uncharacterized membrane protein YgaE (UPF0421/DUF939 family)
LYTTVAFAMAGTIANNRAIVFSCIVIVYCPLWLTCRRKRVTGQLCCSHSVLGQLCQLIWFFSFDWFK